MMASRTTRRLVLGLLLALVILTLLQQSDAKGTRSSRATSRRTQARRSRRRSDSRTPSTKGKSNTNVVAPKAKTFHSGVNRAQLQKSPASTQRFVTAAAFGAITFYLLKSPIAKVYGGHYRPYHDTSNIVIPKDRALRIVREEYRVEARNGSACRNGTLAKYDTRNVLNVTTKVSYASSINGTVAIPSRSSHDLKQANLTISSDAIDKYTTNFEIRVFFNQGILKTNLTGRVSNGTNTTAPMDLSSCRVFVYQAEAYVVEISSFSFKNTASLGLFLFAFLVQLCFNCDF